MTTNNPTVGFQNLPNSKVASRQLIRSIYQPGCIIINNCALCPLQAQGMASVPRSLRYACERAHTLGLPDCTAGRKQGRARSEIACRNEHLLITLHRRNARRTVARHRQETHRQLNANIKCFSNHECQSNGVQVQPSSLPQEACACLRPPMMVSMTVIEGRGAEEVGV